MPKIALKCPTHPSHGDGAVTKSRSDARCTMRWDEQDRWKTTGVSFGKTIAEGRVPRGAPAVFRVMNLHQRAISRRHGKPAVSTRESNVWRLDAVENRGWKWRSRLDHDSRGASGCNVRTVGDLYAIVLDLTKEHQFATTAWRNRTITRSLTSAPDSLCHSNARSISSSADDFADSFAVARDASDCGKTWSTRMDLRMPPLQRPSWACTRRNSVDRHGGRFSCFCRISPSINKVQSGYCSRHCFDVRPRRTRSRQHLQKPFQLFSGKTFMDYEASSSRNSLPSIYGKLIRTTKPGNVDRYLGRCCNSSSSNNSS